MSVDKQKRIYQELEKTNISDDPWETDHPYNQKTFTQLIELIKSVPHTSILEIGCAQGSFTKYLMKISHDVTAIDVSSVAINKAKPRVKGAKFQVSTLEDFSTDKHFDVIVCAEVLYYMKDAKKTLNKLQSLGDYLVTSQYLFCMPQFSLGTVKYEWALRKFELLKRQFATYHNPLTLTTRTLRKLQLFLLSSYSIIIP